MEIQTGSNPGGTSSGVDQFLFVACAAGKEEVIRAVLSVYVRRGRLPEPGELMFCTDSTSDEDLELAVRRFVDRRRVSMQGQSGTSASGSLPGDRTRAAPGGAEEGRAGSTGDVMEGSVHVIADVHRLSYSSQAALRDHIRSLALDCSVDDGVSDGGNVATWVLRWLVVDSLGYARRRIGKASEAARLDLEGSPYQTRYIVRSISPSKRGSLLDTYAVLCCPRMAESHSVLNTRYSGQLSRK